MRDIVIRAHQRSYLMMALCSGLRRFPFGTPRPEQRTANLCRNLRIDGPSGSSDNQGKSHGSSPDLAQRSTLAFQCCSW